jgi:hypothetical protein
MTRIVGLIPSPLLDLECEAWCSVSENDATVVGPEQIRGHCVRAALARHLGVSRACVTQVLRRLLPGQAPAKAETAQSPLDGGEVGGRP